MPLTPLPYGSIGKRPSGNEYGFHHIGMYSVADAFTLCLTTNLVGCEGCHHAHACLYASRDLLQRPCTSTTVYCQDNHPDLVI